MSPAINTRPFLEPTTTGRPSSRSVTVTPLEDDAEGLADWKPYEIEGSEHKKHKTTLLALEKTSKNVTKKGDQRKAKEDDIDDGRDQALLPGITPEDDEEEEEDEIEYAAFITSFSIQGRGVKPYTAGPTVEGKTAFGVGQLYRKRWSIETAFRDIKRNFKTSPRSRCLGIRRFFFALCILLYNCWVVLNLIVADEMEHREDDEIIWRKKIFVIDIHNEVFSDLEFG